MSTKEFLTYWLAIAGFFFSLGAIYGQLTARIPALQVQIKATASDIGIAMFCIGLGSLSGFLSMPLFYRYFANHKILKVAMIILFLAFPVCGLARSPLELQILCLFLGFIFAIADVTMGTQGVLLEHQSKRYCLSSLHACYSLGTFAGAISASIFAASQILPLQNFIIIAIFLLLICLWAMFYLLAQAKYVKKQAEKVKIPTIIIIFGLLAIASFAVEGACAEWGALFLKNIKGASESLSALSFGAFSLSVVIFRLMGDYLRSNLKDYTIIKICSLLSICGMLMVLFIDSPLICLLGYAITGAGVAPLFPIMLSRASQRADISPQKSIVVITSMGYSGMLIIPPSIGFLADSFGLAKALLLPLIFSFLILLACPLFKEIQK